MPGTKAVVIDNGSAWIKAGFAGDDAPKLVFPSVLGRPRRRSGPNPDAVLIGEEALKKRGMLTLRYPLVRGRIAYWDDMEHLWRHAFTALGVSPSNQPLLMTQLCPWPAKDVDKLIETMFGVFGVPALYLAGEAALTLLASSAHTGAVLSIGDTQSHAVCVQGGVELPASWRQIDLGAQHVNDYLQKIMMERNYSFTAVAEKEVARDIKEKLCYVATDIDAELQAAAESSALERDYTLSDGSVVTLGNERFRAPEVFFKPSLIGAEWDGVDKQVYDAIAHSPAELRKDLYGNIVAAGGSAKIPGLAERVKKELTALAPSSMDIQVTVPQEPAYAAWKGGSLLASSPSFEHRLLTKEEYGETGTQMFYATREQDLRRTLAIATASADGARLQAIPPHQVASALWFDYQGIGRVKLTNISDQPIAGPLHLVFAGVPDTMHFQSFPNSQTNAAKRPCVTAPDTTTLAPGQSAVIRFLLATGSSQLPVTNAVLTAEICTGQLD